MYLQVVAAGGRDAGAALYVFSEFNRSVRRAGARWGVGVLWPSPPPLHQAWSPGCQCECESPHPVLPRPCGSGRRP